MESKDVILIRSLEETLTMVSGCLRRVEVVIIDEDKNKNKQCIYIVYSWLSKKDLIS